MSTDTTKYKDRILIVDDSAFNRIVLKRILSDLYILEEASSAEETLAILSRRSHEFSLVLLDLIMPGMGGFGLLEKMNEYQWIGDLPVIMVSSETDSAMIKRAYSLGITDFIRRPYEPEIVQQRIKNTLALYAKQRRLAEAIAEKYYENEKNSNLMISILSNVVEFRNGESGPHVLHIKKISWFLLQQVLKKGPQTYTAGDVHMLCKAAALHDIGKIAIPDQILNKPGRLTPEEFKIMQQHSQVGADMLKNLVAEQDEPLVKAAYEICRWHHERWDGRGYPDGLKGNEIPMHAQVVALADVYDALTSQRCYKEAYPHEKAVQMIMDGECGAFNPMLLECMREVQADLKHLAENPLPEEMVYDPQGILDQSEYGEDMVMTRDLVHRVAVSQRKEKFLADYISEPAFYYCREPSMLTLSRAAQELLKLKEQYINPEDDEKVMECVGKEQAEKLLDRVLMLPRNNGDYSVKATLRLDGQDCPCTLRCRNVWLLDPPTVLGVIGLIRRESENNEENVRI